MPEIIADPLLPFCYQLFPRPEIQESQQLGPDPFLPRAREARGRFATGSRQPAGLAARHCQPQAARARSRRPAIERAEVVGSARLQASFVAAPRRATFAAAARFHRPGGASRDRPVVGAHGRGLSPRADHRSWGHFTRRNRARRGRAHRAAGACQATRGPVSRAIWASVGRVNPR